MNNLNNNTGKHQQTSEENGSQILHKLTSDGDIRELCSRRLGRAAFLQVNLDALTHNINLIRALCTNKNAGVCAMVKANGYGHGSVEIGRHLKRIGVERLGVATVDEGVELRKAGIGGPIHLMGNVQDWEMERCLKSKLIPTVADHSAVRGMAQALAARKVDSPGNRYDGALGNRELCKCANMPPDGAVHIKVDSGMRRNGCQPADLMELVELCDELDVPVEGVYTHLAHFEDANFTKRQQTTFLEAIKPLRGRNMLFHLANSGAIVTGVSTDLDMVRPGISAYGLSPGDDVEGFAALGFQPVASIKAAPSLVKQLQPGDKVGYGCSYECQSPEWLATIPIGYGDGYFRSLSNKGCVIRDSTGERCPLVGRVSMDAMTIRLQTEPTTHELFTVMTDDFDPLTSANGMATTLDTISYEIMTRITSRVPRIYVSSTRDPVVCKLT